MTHFRLPVGDYRFTIQERPFWKWLDATYQPTHSIVFIADAVFGYLEHLGFEVGPDTLSDYSFDELSKTFVTWWEEYHKSC